MHTSPRNQCLNEQRDYVAAQPVTKVNEKLRIKMYGQDLYKNNGKFRNVLSQIPAITALDHAKFDLVPKLTLR